MLNGTADAIIATFMGAEPAEVPEASAKPATKRKAPTDARPSKQPKLAFGTK
mgnify:CR=1